MVWRGAVRCGMVWCPSLLCRVRSKDFKKRALQRIPFTLGQGVQLGVGV